MGREKYSKGRKPTLVYDTGEREDDALARLQWVIPAVFLSTVLIVLFSVGEWVDPTTPVLLFVGLVWMPTVFALLYVNDGNNPKKFAAACAMLAMFGLPLSGWMFGDYRMGMRTLLEEVAGIEIGAEALNDPHNPVATLACRLELESEEVGQYERVKEAVYDRPEVAGECLESVRRDGASRGRIVRLAMELHDEWYQEWMRGRSLDPDLECRRIEQSPTIASAYGQTGVPELLNCRFNAERDAVAACCGEVATEVARHEEVQQFVAPTEWARRLEQPLFEALSEAVDMPASTLGAEEPFDESLAWTPSELFHWTSHLGCHLLETHPDTEGVARRLNALTERQCGIDGSDGLYSFSAVRFAHHICDDIAGTSDRRVDVDRWCERSDVAARTTAVETAKFAVSDARQVFFDRMLARFILTGYWLVERAEARAPFVRPFDRIPTWVASDGLPLRRPTWVRTDREGLEQIADIEEDRQQRRDDARDELQHDVPDEHLERDVDDAVRQQVREDLAELREEYADDDE